MIKDGNSIQSSWEIVCVWGTCKSFKEEDHILGPKEKVDAPITMQIPQIIVQLL